jgi:hypothetical protein
MSSERTSELDVDHILVDRLHADLAASKTGTCPRCGQGTGGDDLPVSCSPSDPNACIAARTDEEGRRFRAMTADADAYRRRKTHGIAGFGTPLGGRPGFDLRRSGARDRQESTTRGTATMSNHDPNISLRAEYHVHENDDWAYEAEDDADYDEGYPNATGIRILEVDDLVALVREWPDHGDIMVSATRSSPIDSAGFKLYLLPEPARRLGLALVRAADIVEQESESGCPIPATATGVGAVTGESTGVTTELAAEHAGGPKP